MRIGTGKRPRQSAALLPKCPTGIAGLDEITHGGLPRGRATLVCGSAGCGKTLLGIEFIVRGATQYQEPGVYVTFEESSKELAENVRSLGFNLERLQRRKLLAMDYVHVERSEIEETGSYDLEGLFVRLGHAIRSVGARRVVLDTVEALFAGLSNAGILRSELRRLFRWLKDQGVTVVVTGEKGEGTLTRHGIEDYLSDCVLVLDHRVEEQRSIRRLRILKYRGSTHGTNEYPFLITADGVSILPVTSLDLFCPISRQRISTGVPGLDGMLGGKGVYRGSTVLISGTVGTGKTSLAAHFADAACARGDRCLFLSFEESAGQIVRNMRSIGIDLEAHVRSGRLYLHPSRTAQFGLESHLVAAHQLTERHRPALVILDPVTDLLGAGRVPEVHAMLMRLDDYLKSRQVTSVFTSRRPFQPRARAGGS